MAHTFDSQNFIANGQKIIASVIPPSISSRQSSLTSSQPSLLYEQNGSRKSYNNQSYSKALHQLPSTSNDSSYYQRQQQLAGNFTKSSDERNNSETKPPPPARMPRIMPATNNNYVHHRNVPSPSLSNETKTKTNTTYLNTTKLYIAQQSPQDVSSSQYPPEPPPVPLRNPVNSNKKNSITIPNFNSSTSEKTIYRSPAITPTLNNSDDNCLENKFSSLAIDNNDHSQETTNESTIREYFGECVKCGETVSNLDDPCDILGQIYHSSCAVCVLCGRSLKNRQFYLQDQLYCEEDFLYASSNEILESCFICGHSITDTTIQALGQSYHVSCFKCSKCLTCLDGLPFLKDKNENLFCLNDYYKTYGTRCDKCLKSICPKDGSVETIRITSMGKNFHVECYHCEDCLIQLNNEKEHLCHPLGDTLLCQECFHQRLVSINKF